MSKGKPVLIVSFHYLPEVMAASYRIHAWAKYLPKFGWEPIILTRYLDELGNGLCIDDSGQYYQGIDEEIGCTVYRVPYRQRFQDIWELRSRFSKKEHPSGIDVVIRRLLNFIIGNFLMLPDERYDWYNSAYSAGLSIARKYNVEKIISTGAPWTDFRVVSELSRMIGVPWVADYRDPWSQPTTLGFQKEYMIRSIVNRVWEKRITKTASALIHISEPLRVGLTEMLHRKVHLIPNGFDPENFQKCQQYSPHTGIFTISFIGTLHTNTRIDVFLEGFQRFVRRQQVSPEVCRVEFIGDTFSQTRIEESYDQFREISKFIASKPSVSQKEANERMCRSHILLSFPLDMHGCFPAKTYEYLASRRPILVSPGGRYRGVVRKILAQTNGGVILNSPEEIANWLGMKFKEFQDTGYVKSSTDWSAVQEYSREKQVGHLAEILESAVAHQK